MNASRPFRSSHNIGGVECDFPSKEELVEYLASDRAGFTHIVTLNAEMVVEAQSNEQFKNIINSAEIVIPDGSSILWAKKYMRSRHPRQRHSGLDPESIRQLADDVDPGSEAGMTRPNIVFSLVQFFFSEQQPITGVDTIFDICAIMQKKNGTVYLLGGKPEEVQRTAIVLRKKYPLLEIEIITDAEISNEEKKLTKLTQLQANSLLLVAYGSPKQSLWIEDNRKILEDAGITIAMGVGGAFAMIAGTLPRAPKWMRRHHIEWLWRLILEPHRIKRIWNAVVVFPVLIHIKK